MVTDFNKKGNREFFNDKLLFKTIGIIFLIVIFVLILADFKMYQKKQKLISQINIYQKQIEDIKNSSQDLKNKITNADNIDYLEKLAYEQLGEQRPGEKEIIFITPQEKTKENAKSENFWDIKLWFSWLNGSWQWISGKF